LIALVLTGVLGPWAWVGVVPLATGGFNFCPLYALVGINNSTPGNWRGALDDHEQIASALEQKDVKKLQKAIQLHFENTIKRVVPT
jgi:hypothetical protein